MDWNVSFADARKIQLELREKINLSPLEKVPQTIAGVDVSMNRFSNVLFAGWIILSYPDLHEIDRSVAKFETTFPYVSGYLSFREIPALLKAYETLVTKPDVTMVDGQGIAHPRRLGIATHLGLELGIPAFGCAKSRLYGVGNDPANEANSISYLHDPINNETIGAWLRTKESVKPVLISPGNGLNLDQSLEIAKKCIRGYRIPEPTRRAHELVNAFRRGYIKM